MQPALSVSAPGCTHRTALGILSMCSCNAPMSSCCACTAFFWAWRFQQFTRGPKFALYGWSLPVAKACGNAMKVAIWPVLILPLSYVFTTPLRCTRRISPHNPHVSHAQATPAQTCSTGVLHFLYWYLWLSAVLHTAG